jgi:hypothetical protein
MFYLNEIPQKRWQEYKELLLAKLESEYLTHPTNRMVRYNGGRALALEDFMSSVNVVFDLDTRTLYVWNKASTQSSSWVEVRKLAIVEKVLLDWIEEVEKREKERR